MLSQYVEKQDELLTVKQKIKLLANGICRVGNGVFNAMPLAKDHEKFKLFPLDKLTMLTLYGSVCVTIKYALQSFTTMFVSLSKI
jgi:hypothetical protein